MPIRRPCPRGRPPRSRAGDAAPEAGERVALVDEPLERQHERARGARSGSTARRGRSAARRRRAAAGRPAPGAGGPAAAARAPGQLRGVARGDAATRRRRADRTAKRTGAFGSAGRKVGEAPGDGPRRRRRRRPTRCAGRRGRRRVAGSAIGGDRVDAQQVGPGEGHATRRPPVGRHELVDRAVRALDADAGRARPGSRSVTGAPGATASAGVARAAQQLAGQVGEQDRERDLERQVRPARLEGQDGRRPAGRGRPRTAAASVPGPGITGARPGRQLQLPRLGDVDRGQVHVAEDRVRRRRATPMPGFVSVPVTVPSGDVRGGAMARIGLAGSSAGQEALEDDQVEQLGLRRPGRTWPA